MLTSKDLMIGDWVRTEAGALIVAGVGHKIYCRANNGNPTHLWEVTSIEPIPLTPEILEKNGWENIDGMYLRIAIDGSQYIEWYPFMGRLSRYYKYKDDHEDIVFTVLGISYIHQLQHALRLCGIEHNIMV